MSTSPNRPPTKGMMMIAAYRAERLNQRPALRTSLHKSHVALRMARIGGEGLAELVEAIPAETPAPAVTGASAQGPADTASVFADLVSTAVAEWQSGVAMTDGRDPVEEPVAGTAHGECAGAESVGAASLATAPQAIRDADPPALSETAAAPPGQAATEASSQPAYDPPLAEIGFGPGMLIRLSQLGLHTTGDLARADATQLREALGDISRLVDVEAWIANAQQTASAASP